MNLSQFIEWLATNPWLIITSFIITIISLPLVIFFISKARKTKSYIMLFLVTISLEIWLVGLTHWRCFMLVNGLKI